MPELPEVISIVNILKHEICNEHLIFIHKSDKYNTIVGEEFLPGKLLPGKLCLKVIDIYNCGKKIFFKLDDGIIIYSFLALTGKWLLTSEKHKHEKIRLVFGKRIGKLILKTKELVFIDMLNFGNFEIKNENNVKLVLKDTGPTYLEIDRDTFLFGIAKHKDKQISDFLLMQKIFSGIGTIYCSESLYDSNIKPYDIIKDIEVDKLSVLFDNIVKNMNLSISLGGCSFSDYINPYGELGRFTPKIYGIGKKHENKTKRKIYF